MSCVEMSSDDCAKTRRKGFSLSGSNDSSLSELLTFSLPFSLPKIYLNSFNDILFFLPSCKGSDVWETGKHKYSTSTKSFRE